VKNTALTFLGIELCLLCVASFAFSAPVPPVGPVDVEGTVLRADWLPEKSVRGIPNRSGSAGFDRTIPARFMVYLTDYSGIDAKAIRRMKVFYRWSASDNLNSSGMPEFIVLQLPHQDKTLIKEGMRVRVRGYVLRGDEGGDWTSYREIQILPSTSARQIGGGLSICTDTGQRDRHVMTA
jgi:hypothetical protein